MLYIDKKSNMAQDILCPICDKKVATGQGSLRNHIGSTHSGAYKKFFCVPSSNKHSFTQHIFLLDFINCWNRDSKETSDWFMNYFPTWPNISKLPDLFCRHAESGENFDENDVKILKKSIKLTTKIPLTDLKCYEELLEVDKSIINRVSYKEIIFNNVKPPVEKQLIEKNNFHHHPETQTVCISPKHYEALKDLGMFDVYKKHIKVENIQIDVLS